MTAPRRVLFVCPVGTRGGAESALYTLWRHLDPRIIESSVFFLRDGPFVAETKRLGLPVCVKPIPRLLAPVAFVRTVAAIRAFALEQRAEVIVDSLGYTHLFGALASRLAGIRSIWWNHSLATRSQWLDRLAATLPTDLVLTDSERARAAHRQLYPATGIVAVLPGLDVSGWKATGDGRGPAIRAALGLGPSTTVVTSVGRLETGKGQDVLIRAAAQVRERDSLRLLLAGGSGFGSSAEFSVELKRLAKELRLDKQVFFLGERGDIPDILAATDIFVHPARFPESFGVAVLEAMASGVPVIATRVGGPEEILGTHACGLLVAPDDAPALARALTVLLRDGRLRKEMGELGRLRAEAFDASKMVETFGRAVREATAGNG